VQEEIVKRLGMREPRIIVRGFDRPNIRLAVEGFAEEEDKRQALITRVVCAPKPGIVHAATRRHTEELATALGEQGVNALAYHAGMASSERERAQEAFMSDAADVIVATSAFGMGIDKPSVRFVYHLDVCDSVDAHYQEIGRAGRDGEPAKAVLSYRPDDLNLHRFFAGSGQVDADEMEQVVGVVQDADGPLDVEDISEEIDLSKTKVTAALNRLEDAGAIAMLPTGEVVVIGDEDGSDAASSAASAQENRRKFARSRIEMMRGYADMRGCRREYILNYVGESYEPPCNSCDNREEGLVITTPTVGELFPVKSRVEHKVWGSGMVMRDAGDTMVVLFDSVGYRMLAVDLVIEKELLTQAA
jgi:ATP-dependent DNA helicase RecQ